MSWTTREEAHNYTSVTIAREKLRAKTWNCQTTRSMKPKARADRGEKAQRYAGKNTTKQTRDGGTKCIRQDTGGENIATTEKNQAISAHLFLLLSAHSTSKYVENIFVNLAPKPLRPPVTLASVSS